MRLEAALAAGRAYLRFLEERIEAAEQRCGGEPECTDPVILIRRLIREAGQPLYIDDILRGLDRPLNREGREAIRQLLLSWCGAKRSSPAPVRGCSGWWSCRATSDEARHAEARSSSRPRRTFQSEPARSRAVQPDAVI